jgi:hypothetical protein
VDQTEDGVAVPQLRRLRIADRWRFHGERGLLSDCPVRQVVVVEGDVFGQDLFEVSTTADQRPVEELTA